MSEYQNEIPMIFRRHGDTNAKSKSHILGNESLHINKKLLNNKLNIESSLSSTSNPNNNNNNNNNNIEGNHGSGQPFIPSFLSNDKKVLCFDAFFLESVHESNIENYRVRKCQILYYLEDNTIQIIERKQENSGLPQGNFIKRHKIPLPEFNLNGEIQYYTLNHLSIGININCYGRTFHIVDCDVFTRNYYLNTLNIKLKPTESYPMDQYNIQRDIQMIRETGKNMDGNYGKKQNPMKEFMEASLGKFLRSNDHLKKFLDYDRHVLRWYALWDDTSNLYGIKHQYILHYFLTDNTVEILEKLDRNSGFDPFPKLLNRTKLIKHQTNTMNNNNNVNNLNNDINNEQYYSWKDFRIGKDIIVYNRILHLLDVDETTREWYNINNIILDKGIDFNNNIISHNNNKNNQKDSLHIQNENTNKSKNKNNIENKSILRYAAYLDTNKPEDKGRNFIICFYCNDNSISITEPPQRNSGIVGGKFLEKSIKKKYNSNEYFDTFDFYISSKLYINGSTFIIDNTDEYTAKYMELNNDKFPVSNINKIIMKIKNYMDINQLYYSKFESLIQENNNKLATLELIKDILFKLLPNNISLQENIYLNDHEIITIIRFLNKNLLNNNSNNNNNNEGNENKAIQCSILDINHLKAKISDFSTLILNYNINIHQENQNNIQKSHVVKKHQNLFQHIGEIMKIKKLQILQNCRQNDSDRSGKIKKIDFINAIEKIGINNDELQILDSILFPLSQEKKFSIKSYKDDICIDYKEMIKKMEDLVVTSMK